MTADLIRCPGCGVNMDLSAFQVRPEQVVCPRCNTRCIVPPAYYQPLNPYYNVPGTQPVQPGAAPGVYGAQQPFNQAYVPQPYGASQPYVMPQPYGVPYPLGTYGEMQPNAAPAFYNAPQPCYYQQMPEQQTETYYSEPQSDPFLGNRSTSEDLDSDSFVSEGLDSLQSDGQQKNVMVSNELLVGDDVLASDEVFVDSDILSNPDALSCDDVLLNGDVLFGNAVQPDNDISLSDIQSYDAPEIQQTQVVPSAIQPIMPLSADASLDEFARSHDDLSQAYDGSSCMTEVVPIDTQEVPEWSVPSESAECESEVIAVVDVLSEEVQGAKDFSGIDVSPTIELQAQEPLASSQVEPSQTTQMQSVDTFLLPIDRKGNAEPLAFALIGFFSTVLLMPFIGIFLCIVSLVMNSQEKKRMLMNPYRGAATFFAVVGIVLNVVLLLFELFIVVSLAMTPAALVALLY